MPFPTNYANAKANNYSYERLRTGGHKCKVLTMQVKLSGNGNKMIELTFDTTMDDVQPNFYVNSEKKGRFSCMVDERLLDRNGEAYGLSNLKRLMTSFEDSNPGFTAVGDNYGVNDAIFCQQFIGKHIGLIMGEEEYEGQDGTIRTSVKAKFPCGYDKAFDAKAPKKRELPRPASVGDGFAAEPFMGVPDALADEGLPFN